MREKVEKYIELIIGSILLSLGIYLFVTPNGINFGGAIGIAQIIEYFIVKMVPSLGHMNLVVERLTYLFLWLLMDSL